jgi:hydrogenase maturation protein HypF
MPGKAIRIRGIVQGVGFRPAIWHLAQQYRIAGSVWNDAQGVMIHAWGEEERLNAFIEQIPMRLPPLAKLDSLEALELDGFPSSNDFRISTSRQNLLTQTPITADAATCPECLAEIRDPGNRRYRYPFTNCTHCGPRLSIIKRIPYDRCNTAMAEFAMCPACKQEYENPADRRFHAQANCCPDCGPCVWLENRRGERIDCRDVLALAADLIRQGHLVAIKGLGGFHLACDAANETAVSQLRQRKRRYAKPFALMAKDAATVERYALLGPEDKIALHDKAAPIVLLSVQGEKLAASVAPEHQQLGFMLPYTPLHAILLQDLDAPIVLTSGNSSDEPQCTDNGEARQKLAEIADYFLLHNRAIVNRLDDSVVRVMAGQARLLRRARGYCPETVALPAGFEKAGGIVALGAELKNTFCLLKNDQAVVSQHIGDLENAVVQRDYRNNLQFYRQLYDFKADAVAVDLHPGYLSTQWGRSLAVAENLVMYPVQHHHAHLAACMAEHGLALDSPPVLGAIFDGLGMGPDGELWGGEFLLADYAGFTRLAHFQPVALPGGTQAIREPWRNAYAQLAHYFAWQTLQRDYADLEIMRFLAGKPLATLATMLAKNLNSPLSSSCGRWFDACAALLGIHSERADYEGQTAIALETLATPLFQRRDAINRVSTYDFSIRRQGELSILSWQPFWQQVLADLQRGVDKALIAARMHHALAAATVALLLDLSRRTATDTVVLSGGVFQNRLLLEAVTEQLQEQGKTVLIPRRYPMNDGGLALGQAAVAAALALAEH